MKIAEQMKKYREMKDADIAKELKSTKKELALASLKVKVDKLTDISSVSKMRKNVARMESIISERIYGAENE